ncbi:unnamed protein product [Nesidiocoris tenuis]|uniref:Uncharacterized protein n=1 Tax=Nesidiocoris tenuis TaxID=355587 RepID=A0A6H5FVF9_9HEMI|nr:unnamed protein product [Nesidiocoris tenuis]
MFGLWRLSVPILRGRRGTPGTTSVTVCMKLRTSQEPFLRSCLQLLTFLSAGFRSTPDLSTATCTWRPSRGERARWTRRTLRPCALYSSIDVQ